MNNIEIYDLNIEKNEETLKEEKIVFANKVLDILHPYIIERNKKINEIKNSLLKQIDDMKNKVEENKRVFNSMVIKYKRRQLEKSLLNLIEKILSEKSLTKEQKNNIKIVLKVLKDLSVERLKKEIQSLEKEFNIKK